MIGIIILNYNTAFDSISCIKSIQEKTSINYKIYVVDNGSTEPHRSELKEFCCQNQIRYIQNISNLGFSAGNNVGIRIAIEDGAEHICLINSDVILENDVLKILLKDLEEDSGIGIVAPSILLPTHSGEGQFARNKITWWNYVTEKSFLKYIPALENRYPRYQIKDKQFEKKYKFKGMVYGCCYLVKSKILQKINYLDEDVFLFGEEDILAYKLEGENLYTQINPNAIIFHNHHNTLKKSDRASVHFHLLISPLIILKKYAKSSYLKLLILLVSDIILWSVYSVRFIEYRRQFVKFIKCSSRIIR